MKYYANFHKLHNDRYLTGHVSIDEHWAFDGVFDIQIGKLIKGTKHWTNEIHAVSIIVDIDPQTDEITQLIPNLL